MAVNRFPITISDEGPLRAAKTAVLARKQILKITLRQARKGQLHNYKLVHVCINYAVV